MKDDRANVKMSKESLKKFQGLKKKGESYDRMIDRLYCKNNPKDKKCRKTDG